MLEKQNYTVFCVGGSVRDSLLGQKASDWDLTTSALPQQICKVFNGFKMLMHGIKYGTVTVFIKGSPIEITTMREDGKYRNHRIPSEVSFTDKIEKDLARRDFTINAMAYHPQTGLIDPYNGFKHLKDKTICCVGNPGTRFQEDALRILRCLRFAAVLGYNIEEATSKALINEKDSLRWIACERVRDEFLKLLCSDFASIVILQYAEIFSVFIPKFVFDDYTIISLITLAPAQETIRLALLLFPMPQEQAKQTLSALRLPKKQIDSIFTILGHLSETVPSDKLAIKRKLIEMGIDNFRQWLTLKEILEPSLPICKVKELSEGCINHGCLKIKDLKIDGNDLKRIGFLAGKELGSTLSYLLEEVINEKLPNDKKTLLSAAKKRKINLR
ncbi:CCA tRNA nucleotidyltransferase [Scatolibacter rhodanostii]|uniref:CCA tRNA nucleotidyltransferase n=1 Tax=Scatolibacter rhodanostii TaxID=2014781 RepID=UPI0013567232|nr:hypothetical protein [Scatolibacter rhodanostii]